MREKHPLIPEKETNMKKILKIAGIGFFSLAVLGIGYSTWRFNSYRPGDAVVTADKTAAAYYRETYDAARAAFLEKAAGLKKEYRGCEDFTISVPSARDKDLTVNILHVPAQAAKKRLLVLSCGVHGVEGYVGSAVMLMFMKEFMNMALLKETGVLFIHGVNPYGFRHNRRVTENNIDLNRNSSADEKLYTTKNTGYPEVASLINPEGKLSTTSPGNLFFHIKGIFNIARKSMGVLRQAILQGQYEFPKGVYFGGKQAEPQISALIAPAKKTMSGYSLIMQIDLHTGYGERGTLHLFPNPIKDPVLKSKTEKIFTGYRIDWGDGADFYTVTGDFTGFMEQLAAGKTFIPMAFEYGTLDSQTTMGAMKSLHITILENQGTQFGYASEKDEAQVKKNFREMYYPSSDMWRVKVIADSRKLFESSLRNF